MHDSSPASGPVSQETSCSGRQLQFPSTGQAPSPQKTMATWVLLCLLPSNSGPVLSQSTQPDAWIDPNFRYRNKPRSHHSEHFSRSSNQSFSPAQSQNTGDQQDGKWYVSRKPSNSTRKPSVIASSPNKLKICDWFSSSSYRSEENIKTKGHPTVA